MITNSNLPELFLTNEQIQSMLGAQYALNNAYNGDKWETDPTFLWRFNAAADAELAEFLEEVTAKWKWYTSKPVFNREAALFELVDVVHFMLAGALKNHGNRIIGEEAFDRIVSFHDDNWYANLSEHYRGFWAATSIRIGHPRTTLTLLRCFIAHGIFALRYTADEFFEAYKLKNQRNHERVSKGVMKGVDVKKDEEALCLTT